MEYKFYYVKIICRLDIKESHVLGIKMFFTWFRRQFKRNLLLILTEKKDMKKLNCLQGDNSMLRFTITFLMLIFHGRSRLCRERFLA